MWQRPSIAIHAIAQGIAIQPVFAAILMIGLGAKSLFAVGDFSGLSLGRAGTRTNQENYEQSDPSFHFYLRLKIKVACVPRS
jgi:hypothetical protein